jgi:iron complex transport system ATP-binding protein
MSRPEVLRLRDVALVRGGSTLLHDIDVTVHTGEHWALLGANGAGKSTLLSLYGAVEHPTRGEVHVLGQQLGRVDIRELRRHIGHVNPRHPLRSPLTVEEVVLTGVTGSIELVPRWVPTAAERSRAAELIDLLGIGRHRADRWTTLSQGERGRALIARALMPDPPLVLLDEPSTGLDVKAREQLLTTIDELGNAQPGLTSILVTHHLEELPSSTTHALLLRDGGISAIGPAAEVLTTANVSACFDHPIEIHRADGRWLARAVGTERIAT